MVDLGFWALSSFAIRHYDVTKAETGIVFIDEIYKIAKLSESKSATRDISGAKGVQQEGFPLNGGKRIDTELVVTAYAGGHCRHRFRQVGCRWPRSELSRH